VVAATILLGFVLALPSRRLNGDYLAIVMLFFLQIFNNFTTNGYAWNWLGLTGPHDVTGGPTGITNVEPFRVFGHVLNNRPTDYVFVSAAGIAVVAILFHYVNRSRTGRAWRALREDPLAAEMMGIPVKWLSLLAVAVGAGVAGFAGSVNGAYYQGVFPDTFMFPLLITVYAMVILGGAGSLPGVVVGAVLVNVTLEVLRSPDHARWVFYVLLIGGLVAKIRPWRALAAVLGSVVVFGLVLHEIVGAVSQRAIAGGISSGVFGFSTHGFLATVLRHWLVFPKGTYEVNNYTLGNIAFVLLIGLLLTLTAVKRLWRYALLVPTIWLAAFVWETRLIEESPTTRPLLLGVILIVLMTVRPQGLLGTPRVEIT
jgi:ABC-type branched-subunit amino acid transport system permease subunit